MDLIDYTNLCYFQFPLNGYKKRFLFSLYYLKGKYNIVLGRSQLFAASSLCGVIKTLPPSLFIVGKERTPPETVTGQVAEQAGGR